MVIYYQPENTTACSGSNVTISCGYLWSRALPVTWIINGTSFTQQEVLDSPLYQLNNPKDPVSYSLTALSINGNTTFQCIVHYTIDDETTTNIMSTHGTVTVIGTYVCTCTINVYLNQTP